MTDTNNVSNTVKKEFSSLCHDSFKSHLFSYLINLCADLRAEKPSQPSFYVCDVENIYRLKAASIIPLQDGDESFDDFYGRKNKSLLALRSLHCLSYKFFNDGMKKFLPHLVIEALDYDEKSLQLLLGDDDYNKVIAAINSPIKDNNQPAESFPSLPKKLSSRLAVITILLFAIPFALHYLFALGTTLPAGILAEANKFSERETVIKQVIKPEIFSTDEIIDFAKEKNEQEKNQAYEKMMKEDRNVACYKKTTYVCDDRNGLLEQKTLDKKYINELLRDVNKVENSSLKETTGTNAK